MARIAEYEAKDLKFNPSEMGETANTQAARRIGSFFEQMASGAKEIGRLQQENDVEIGKQLTSFLRFKGLEDVSGARVTVKGGVEKTLIGTGAGGDRTVNYNDLGERVNGPSRLSRLAADQVAANSPIKDTVEHGVNVLRGGADQTSDSGTGVTVLRGGQPYNAPEFGTPKDTASSQSNYQPGLLSPYTNPDNQYFQSDANGGFPLPVGGGTTTGSPIMPPQEDSFGTDVLPSLTGPDVGNPNPSSIEGTGSTTGREQQYGIPIEQSDAPAGWADQQGNM